MTISIGVEKAFEVIQLLFTLFKKASKQTKNRIRIDEEILKSDNVFLFYFVLLRIS